jgi:hypothetical protein
VELGLENLFLRFWRFVVVVVGTVGFCAGWL